ncbi:GPI-anchored wall transfer protein 1 [Rhizodiscina lignyota]|uniref:GPI-anchored wall transfer protein n=1 Tax=Rhizodiscina lignyota TaxID=1504668 RepID=A0A9P4IJA6_9PEZI|nr:GPI-anchored wall transfer protein 1 [Rhizodiscina lignyota]
MDAKYKSLKEDFVSNLSGGSVWEMNLVTLVAPASVLLWSVLQSRKRAFTPYTIEACLTDCLLNCGAILFVTTIYSGYPAALNAFLLLPALVTYFSSPVKSEAGKPRPTPIRTGDGNAEKDETGIEKAPEQLPMKPFLTAYRGSMLVVTAVGILAVDFKVFPRRFAKVENWGTSLMDMGVGSFVFSGGLVSARSILREQLSGRKSSLLQRLRASLWHSLPLLVLGAIRLFSVKGLDYAEHVSEYGVHWNFFFTLGLLPPFMALFQSMFDILPSYSVLAILVACVYQSALDSTELTAFILTAPRTDLFSQNREGIFSFAGYLAIFLAGLGTGMYVLPRRAPPVPPWLRWLFPFDSVFGRLATWSIFWTILFSASTSYDLGGLEVSRRLANLPYVLWVSAFNTAQLTLFCGIEGSCFRDLHNSKIKDAALERKKAKEATSRVLYAFNRNGLALFLLANLLTGLVNMTLPTLHMGNLQAMGVLVAYMGVMSAVALALDAWNISVKI